ncbi:MAG: NAD(P)H-hydrate dehydratase [Woeseiaceae bacterium]|nr:NAD(P)H-hydrate dehydratase [Woeseiaceae bacterium]
MSYVASQLYSVDAVRGLDRCAIETHGIPGYDLMRRAGGGLFESVFERMPDARHWVIVCGGGNNAGDGYVVAALALKSDRLHSVIALSDPDKLGGDARKAFDDYVDAGGSVDAWKGQLPGDGDLVIDAILGSGLDRDVAGDYADAIHAINHSGLPVASVDIPSGLNGDTGRIMGVAVSADMTRSFVGWKAGMFIEDGPDACGQLDLDTIGVPEACYQGADAVMQTIPHDVLDDVLPPRGRTTHKGDFGHVLVVGGGPGMPGAVRLCGEAALRTGSGRVSVATHPSHASSIAIGRPELMCHAVSGPDELKALLEKVEVVAFGPGLGQSDWSVAVHEVVASSRLPAVWDADALNLLAQHQDPSDHRIITPHPGEAARLLGASTTDVQSDRVAAAQQLQIRYGGVAVLKGAGTLVNDGHGPPWLCTAGNPGMAAPGMGDALTGIIASLLGQGLEPTLAATAGVQTHAAAGDLASLDGERGLMASDLIDNLRFVVNP